MSSHVERSAKMPERNDAAGTRDLSKPGSVQQTAASPPPRSNRRNRMIIAGVLLVAGVAAAWILFSGSKLPPGFAGGNGRLEANQVYVATKYAGRVLEVLFNEGDTVDAGQVVARMDTSALEAQLRQALAQITEAEVEQARMLASRAELVGAQADATRTSASIDAAKATADRLRAEIKDAVLVSPIRARIETRLAEPGEVLAQGGRVFSLNDLSDVYMYVFLPESVTGKVPVGSEARIVLDAAKQYPIRAYVAFVSPMAQFTPKSVETAEERHNLTFRVKLQIPKERLRQYEALVKSGLPGMGYVRYDQQAAWPKGLQVNPNIPKNLWEPTGARSSN